MTKQARGTVQQQLNSANQHSTGMSDWQQLVSEFVFGPVTGRVHSEPGIDSHC